MVMVFLGSVRPFAGKNVVALGLGRRLLDDGYRVAYTKPYGGNPEKVEGVYTDADAWTVNQALELGQSPADCCPVVRNQDLLTRALRGETGDLMGQTVEHCRRLAEGKDVLIVSGAGTLRSGAMMDLGGYDLLLALGARAVLVEPYENEYFLDDLLSAARRLGDSLAGVVINSVDQAMNEPLEDQVVPFLAQHDVPTFGRLPKDELLSSVSVEELAEFLGGKPVCCLRSLDRLVTRFLIGAMQVKNAQKFFGGGRDFACLVGGDRPDMQMAAIEGGAACIILTGNFYPSDLITSRAEELDVPILVVRDDTFSVARALDLARNRGSLRREQKIQRAMELVGAGVDFPALYRAVGLGAPA